MSLKKNIYFKIWSYLLLFIPISIISGSLLLNANLFLITIFFLINVVKFQEIRKFLKTDWFLVSCFYLLFLIFSTSLNDFRIHSALRSITFFKFFIFALSLSIIFIIDEKKFLNFLKIYFLIFCFVIFDALIQYIFGKNILGITYDIGRVSGIFGEEKILGSFISKSIFIVTPLLIYFLKKNILKNLFLILWFGLATFIILISGGRMSFLHIFMAVHLFYIINIFKDYRKIFYLIPIYIMIVVLFISDQNVFERFKNITHKDYGISKNFNIKDSQWGAHYLVAYEIFKDNPLVGIGPKNFRIEACKEKYSNIDSEKSDIRCSTHPHNIVLEILSEQGIIGMIFFLLLIFFTLKRFNLNKEINFFLFLSFLIFIWPIGTSGSIFTSWNGIFLWINIGIISFLKEKNI